jgi:uncharacterized protein
MTPQETALVTMLLGRLKTAGGQPKDPDAETRIREATAEQQDAAYYLAQIVLIRDLSLHTAQTRIAELEKNLVEAKASSPPASFLGGLLGTRQPPLAAGPGNPAPSALGGVGGGSFLRSAAATAAGVAGGVLMLEGTQSMFTDHDAAGGIANGRGVEAAGSVCPDYGSGGSEQT